jgi:hypothetical protein
MYLIGINPATRDVRYVSCFTGQDRRTRKVSEIGSGGDCTDIRLPIFGKIVGYIV